MTENVLQIDTFRDIRQISLQMILLTCLSLLSLAFTKIYCHLTFFIFFALSGIPSDIFLNARIDKVIDVSKKAP